MRRWDGEPTFKLEGCVRGQRGKTAVKGPPKNPVSVAAVETQEGHRRSPRPRRTEIASLNPGEGTSGLPPQGSDSECSEQEQRVPAFGQEEEKDDWVYWTVWIGWPGPSDPHKYKALVDTVCSVC